MSPLKAISQLVRLDDAEIPEVALVIVGYIDKDGTEGFKYHVLGEPNLATTVGLLARVQADMLTRVE